MTKSRQEIASQPASEQTLTDDLGSIAAQEGAAATVRASARPSINQVRISPDERIELYVLSRRLSSALRAKVGVKIPFLTYFQDPFVAEKDPSKGLDDKTLVDWEPGLTDGPTSARFAVVDYDADSGVLTAPAVWDEKLQQFVQNGTVLDHSCAHLPQFHQVSVWALLQATLAFFEDGNGLGRSIPWAFEGNRLIVVPHAGQGKNAYYDRESKSLQFYYFEAGGKTVYTCLSSDIVRHEFGHAVLDGIRPLFNESVSPETAAFHEFMGDLTAVLTTLRNNTLRGALAEATNGRIEEADTISSIAEEFGQAVSGRDYLRTAANQSTMPSLKGEMEPHLLSEVLTGTMFEILVRSAHIYQNKPPDETTAALRTVTPKQAFWHACERMQRTAIQPLDLLPPVEVTFRDYAKAVCRAQKLADPIDPRGYYEILLDVFRKREILTDDDIAELRKPTYLLERLRLSVPRGIDEISRSLAAAYRFLDDNREDLLIPAYCDFIVSDLYDARKRGRQGLPSRQIVLEYAWREDVPLQGARFGRFEGRTTTMLCGGTLVFNEAGAALSCAIKPGSLPYGGKRQRAGAVRRRWDAAVAEGSDRRVGFLDNLANRIAQGAVGNVIGTGKGMLGSQVAPLTAEDDGDMVRFRLSPHLNLSHEPAPNVGERLWELSC